MSIDDAVTRISQIQSMLSALQTGTLPTQAAGTAATTGSAAVATPAATPSAGATSGVDFATALAQAQSTDPTASASSAYPVTAAGAGAYPASAYPVSASTYPVSYTTVGISPTVSTATSGLLTSDQQQFASRLAADTGLDPGVVSAWLLAEESGGAAQGRQGAGNNDWLNIGYTDSGTYGSTDSVWSNPITAADATAGWLKGQNTIPGYGTASSGIQAILSTVGQPPQAQVAAIQGSGWASSGYPNLPSLVAQVSA